MDLNLLKTRNNSKGDKTRAPKKNWKDIELDITFIFRKTFSNDTFDIEYADHQLSDLYEVILAHPDDVNPDIVRNANILQYIYMYLDNMIANPTYFEIYAKEILQACYLLALFLHCKIFKPIEIASTPLIKTMRMFVISNYSVLQEAGAVVFSCMIQPNEELPQYVINKFLGLSFTLRTSFVNKVAKQACIYFIHEVLKNYKDLPGDMIISICENLTGLLKDKSHCYLLPQVLDCMHMIILYQPKYFDYFLQYGAIEIANNLLRSNKGKIVQSANHLFSVIFAGGVINMEPFCNLIPYESIIENCDYVIKPKIQKSSIWLLIDIISNGPQFIEQLFKHNFLKFLFDIYSDQELELKKLFIILYANLLYFSRYEQSICIMKSDIFDICLTDLPALSIPTQINFVKCALVCMQNLNVAGLFDSCRHDIARPAVAEAAMTLLEVGNEVLSSFVNIMMTDLTEGFNNDV